MASDSGNPSAPPLDPLACIACGYNLHGLAIDGNCPECGRAIRDSYEFANGTGLNLPEMRALDRGLRWLGAGIGMHVVWPAWMILTVIVLATGTPGTRIVAAAIFIFPLTESVFWVAGVICFCTLVSKKADATRELHVWATIAAVASWLGLTLTALTTVAGGILLFGLHPAHTGSGPDALGIAFAVGVVVGQPAWRAIAHLATDRLLRDALPNSFRQRFGLPLSGTLRLTGWLLTVSAGLGITAIISSMIIFFPLTGVTAALELALVLVVWLVMIVAGLETLTLRKRMSVK